MVALSFAVADTAASAAIPVQLCLNGTGSTRRGRPGRHGPRGLDRGEPIRLYVLRIPPGTTTCDLVRSWPSPGAQTIADSPGVFVSPTQVVITPVLVLLQ